MGVNTIGRFVVHLPSIAVAVDVLRTRYVHATRTVLQAVTGCCGGLAGSVIVLATCNVVDRVTVVCVLRVIRLCSLAASASAAAAASSVKDKARWCHHLAVLLQELAGDL